MSDTLKTCAKCLAAKPRKEFSRRNNAAVYRPSSKKYKNASDGLQSWCNGCKNQYNKRFRANKGPDGKGLYWKYDEHVKRTYGLTKHQYNQLLQSQNGVCAICGHCPKKQRLCVDHDHATLKVRGILCPRCNIMFEWYIRYKAQCESYFNKQQI